MNELQVFSTLHKYLNNLGPMEFALAPKSLTLGYKPVIYWGARTKFATLYGEKKYNCLILHVDPGNPESTKGKAIQKEVQQLIDFDIREIRKLQLKKHEVFIPFEVIDSKEKMDLLKTFVKVQYEEFLQTIKKR